MLSPDLSGKEFGRLTVIERAGSSKNGHALWFCWCKCGNASVVFASNLKRRHTQSCGCLNTEVITKHGLRLAPEYQSWKAMIQRCYNPKAAGYEYYVGRGIAVCESWRKSFEAFYTDMGQRSDASFSIDRIDNDGDYEKSNCRWADSETQQSNKRPKGTAFIN